MQWLQRNAEECWWQSYAPLFECNLGPLLAFSFLWVMMDYSTHLIGWWQGFQGMYIRSAATLGNSWLITSFLQVCFAFLEFNFKTELTVQILLLLEFSRHKPGPLFLNRLGRRWGNRENRRNGICSMWSYRMKKQLQKLPPPTHTVSSGSWREV